MLYAIVVILAAGWAVALYKLRRHRQAVHRLEQAIGRNSLFSGRIYPARAPGVGRSLHGRQPADRGGDQLRQLGAGNSRNWKPHSAACRRPS